MYLVKLSRPELINTVRELSTVMDKGTDNHFKILKRVIAYVIKTKTEGMKIKPVILKKWIIEAFADSDFCGTEIIEEASQVLLFFNGVEVSWKFKSKNNVSLSTTEAVRG